MSRIKYITISDISVYLEVQPPHHKLSYKRGIISWFLKYIQMTATPAEVEFE